MALDSIRILDISPLATLDYTVNVTNVTSSTLIQNMHIYGYMYIHM